MSDNNHENSPLKFPCDFDIKVMGRSSLEFQALIVGIIRKHVPKLSEAAVNIRYSKDQNYISMTINIFAESREQLDNIYRELHAQDDVLMTL